MKKTSTLLLAAFSLFSGTAVFASSVTPKLTSPAAGQSGNVSALTITLTHDYAAGFEPTVTVVLKSINGIALTPALSSASTTLNPAGTGKDFSFDFSATNLDGDNNSGTAAVAAASSDFEIDVIDNNNAANNKSLVVSQAAPLPVELISFKAVSKGSELNLNWATATEKNSSHFEIEESFTGSEFSKLGSVKAHGNSNALNAYSFSAKNRSVLTYYRLKMVDLDGTFQYSNIVSVSNASKDFRFAINKTTVNFSVNADEKISRVLITDLMGQVIFASSSIADAIKTNYSGIGVIRLETNKNSYQVKTFIQQ